MKAPDANDLNLEVINDSTSRKIQQQENGQKEKTLLEEARRKETAA